MLVKLAKLIHDTLPIWTNVRRTGKSRDVDVVNNTVNAVNNFDNPVVFRSSDHEYVHGIFQQLIPVQFIRRSQGWLSISKT